MRDAERGVRVARRNLLPDLKLITTYERVGDGTTSSEASDLDEDVWFVGLGADTDLPRRREKLNLEQARITESSSKLSAESVEAAVRKQVKLSILSYDQAQADVLFAEKNYHLAKSRSALARRLFEIGRGDNFSVTDAESSLFLAQNQLLAAQADASAAAYRLLRVMGTLMTYPEDLKPVRTGL